SEKAPSAPSAATRAWSGLGFMRDGSSLVDEVRMEWAGVRDRPTRRVDADASTVALGMRPRPTRASCAVAETRGVISRKPRRVKEKFALRRTSRALRRRRRADRLARAFS